MTGTKKIRNVLAVGALAAVMVTGTASATAAATPVHHGVAVTHVATNYKPAINTVSHCKNMEPKPS